MNEKVLLKNFSSLFFIQIANYILPFFVIPYIVRIVGVKNFGIITFSYIFIAYFNLIIDYGFKLIITRDIAKYRNSIKRLSILFWKMYISQLFLLLFSLLIFIFLITFFTFFSKYKIIYEFAFLIVIGNFLFPVWFFQGIEKMEMIAVLDVIARVIYVVLVFLFLKEKEDFIYVPLFNGLSFVLIGFISIVLIVKKYKLLFIRPKFKQIKSFYKEGWHLFLSNVAVNLYSNFNTFLLGLISGYNAVGVYSLAEKIFGAIVKVIGILNIVFFPQLANIKNKEILILNIKNLIKKYIFILIPISLSLFLFSNYAVEILFGSGHSESVLILKILALVLLFRPFGQLFTNYLIIEKQNFIVSKITFYIMLLNIVIVLPMVYFFNEIGLAITVLIIQIYQVYLTTKTFLKG